MNDITQGMKFTIDVKSGLVEMPQRAVLMKGDKNANRVSMALYDGEKAVSLEGATVTGTYVLAGIKIPLLGDVNENEATIILPDECYLASGRYELRMHVTLGSVKRTFLFITGYVESDGEGGTLDVEGAIPNIDDIIAQYEQMKAVTERTQEAADKANDAASRAPYVGTNGNWYVWHATSGKYVDTGTKATGPQGPKGDPGTMENVTITSINGLPEALSSLSQQIEELDAEAVGALPAGGTAANSEKLGGKAPSAYVQIANVLDTLEEVTANTADGMVAGAMAVKELYQVAKSTDITLQYAGNALNTSTVRKWGRLVHAQINIGISRYPEQGDSWYKIGKIPNGYIPNNMVVKTLGALEIWSVPRSLVSVSINDAGQIEAIVADTSYDIVAEQGPAIVANLFYFV